MKDVEENCKQTDIFKAGLGTRKSTLMILLLNLTNEEKPHTGFIPTEVQPVFEGEKKIFH